MSTWLFPFIALIAQLPFETESHWYDFLSACMAVGSPALVAYSLALTVLNRSYMSSQFKKLKNSVRDNDGSLSHITARLDTAAFIVAEVRQAPIRASNHAGWLDSLIGLEKNDHFWSAVEKGLKNTRRGFTYSFFAQGIYQSPSLLKVLYADIVILAMFAFIAYLFSFIAAYSESLGSTDIGLQFSTSIVWSWMYVPYLALLFKY